MKGRENTILPIMVIGDNKSAYSVAYGLVNEGQSAILLTADGSKAFDVIYENFGNNVTGLQVIDSLPEEISSSLVVLVTDESIEIKSDLIQQVETRSSGDTIIAVNCLGIHLDELQLAAKKPERVFGLNFSYPAHLTFFAEVIASDCSDAHKLRILEQILREGWKKDPYTVSCGFSVQARLFGAMVREALHLVESGYATIESVDRACRNDAGYYLPFAGNFRYMDLMGTYAYGMVMKDLNSDLAQTSSMPDSLRKKLQQGEAGMASGKGFYDYPPGEEERWNEIFKTFSHHMRDLIIKYSHETTDN